ncbi:MAG: (2Fe-2S) ferredoxin domain-containing protein, partial [Prolixibacteraceae bacterium]|nr:(2Fe-2S) ferredoxin domain-containing protein [Prolixibacteraceae bacterium]
MADTKMHILVCGGTGCRASQAESIKEQLNSELEIQGLENEVKVVSTGCFGFCEKGPVVKIIPDDTFYTQVTPADAHEIIAEHILKGRPVQRLLYTDPV